MDTQLSPRTLADAMGVSESSVKRWVDGGRLVATRTAGGHRRIAQEEAIRFIRANGVRVARPELLGFPELGDVPQGDSLTAALFEALSEGWREKAFGLIYGPFMDGWGVAQIADEAIAPAMWRLGDLWRHRPEGIFIEHRATDLCIEAIERLRWSLPEPPPEAPVAVGAAAANDPYLMPTLLAVTVLRETGFRAVNLGPETPAETLMQAVRDQRPRLAWLSVSTTVAADALAGKLTRLAAECGELGARLIVGGRVHGLLRKDAGEAVTFGANMGELAAFARGLLAGA